MIRSNKAPSILLLTLMFEVVMVHAATVDYGLDFTEGAGGASHGAMGGVGVALASSEFGAWWNPSLAGLSDKWQSNIEHAEWFRGELQRDQVYLDLPVTHAGGAGFWILRTGVAGIPLTSLPDEDAAVSSHNRPGVDRYARSSQCSWVWPWPGNSPMPFALASHRIGFMSSCPD